MYSCKYHSIIISLPSLQRRYFHTDPVLRGHCRGFTEYELFLRILEFKLESSNKCGQQTSQLGFRKTLPNATTRAMYEGQKGVVAGGTASVGLAGAQPPVGIELIRIRAPKGLIVVGQCGHDLDYRTLRDFLTDKGGVSISDANRVRYGGVEAEDFLADSMEIRELCVLPSAGGYSW